MHNRRKDETNMNYLFHLRGDVEEIAAGEALGALEAEGIEYGGISTDEGMLLVECPRDIDAARIAGRLALSHSVNLLLGECDADMGSITEAAKSLDWELIDGVLKRKTDTYLVRCTKIGNKGISGSEVEREFGRSASPTKRADMKNPDAVFRIFITQDVAYITLALADIQKKQFRERAPNRRPRFHPASLMPDMARAYCNLARMKRGDAVLDPFCGVGGLLIEAGLLGAELHGCDIEEDLVEGAKENLKCYYLEGNVVIGDARNAASVFQKIKFDAVVMDPPYGISTKVPEKERLSPDGDGAVSLLRYPLEKLYGTALAELAGILKKGRYLVMSLPNGLNAGAPKEFEVRESYKMRIHKSLTKEILVLKRI